MSDTACPVCGSDGVAACVTPGGTLMGDDHPGRPPYFDKAAEAALDSMARLDRSPAPLPTSAPHGEDA